MNIRFYLESKESQSGQNAIWCYVRENDKSIYLNTKEKVEPEYWDNKLKRADEKKSRDKIVKGRLQSLNKYLNQFESKILEVIRETRLKNFDATFEDISVEIKKIFTNKSKSFFDDFDDFISARSTKVKDNTIKKYKQTKNVLRQFEKDAGFKLSYSKINALFLDKYFPYLIYNKKFIDNTAYKHISFLKAFMNWAVERNLTKNKEFRSFKIKFHQNDVVYLTKKELDDIYKLKIVKEKLARVRDIFVFQCFTGVRFSDAERISFTDIKGFNWRFRSKKGDQILNIRLTQIPMEILDKYRDWERPLPIISNQKMNEYLKEIGKLAEIDTIVKTSEVVAGKRIEDETPKYNLITTHTARRTFISLSIKQGLKPEYIMKVTGHSDYRMMKRYLGIDNSTVDKEMDKAWGSPLRLVKKK